MSKITIDWEFWKYAWGSYLGKKPGQYPRQSDEVQLLPFSKESEAVLDVMKPDYWMQCWELWNAPLALPGSYFHALQSREMLDTSSQTGTRSFELAPPGLMPLAYILGIYPYSSFSGVGF